MTAFLLGLALSALVAAAAASWGWPLARRLLGETIAGAAFALLLGLGALSQTALLLAGAGALSRPALLALLAVLAIRRRALRDVARLLAHSLPQRLEARLFIGAFALLNALPMLATPPIDSDACTYHIALPEAWIETGRSLLDTGFFFTFLPHLHEGLMCYGLAIPGAESALVGLALLPLVIIAALFASTPDRAGAGRELAWYLVLGTPAFVVLSLFLKNNPLQGAAFVAAIIPCLGEQDRPTDLKRAIACGIAFGLSLLTQYTSISFIPLLALLWIRAFRPSSIMAASLAAVFVASPLYIRNIVETGNLIYPMQAGSSSVPLDATAIRAMISGGMATGLAGRWEPFGLGSTWGLLLPLGALGFLLRDRYRLAALVAVATVLGLTLMTTNSATGTARYGIGASLFLAWGAARFWNSWPSSGTVVAATTKRWLPLVLALFGLAETMVIIGHGPPYFGGNGVSPFQVLAGNLSREAYRESYIPESPAARWAREHLPARVSVTAIGVTRSYGWGGRIETVYLGHDPAVVEAIRTASSDSEAIALLVDHGFTHLFLNHEDWAWLRRDYGFADLSPAEEDRLTAIISRCRPIFREGPIELLEFPLHPTDPNPPDFRARPFPAPGRGGTGMTVLTSAKTQVTRSAFPLASDLRRHIIDGSQRSHDHG